MFPRNTCAIIKAKGKWRRKQWSGGVSRFKATSLELQSALIHSLYFIKEILCCKPNFWQRDWCWPILHRKVCFFSILSVVHYLVISVTRVESSCWIQREHFGMACIKTTIDVDSKVSEFSRSIWLLITISDIRLSKWLSTNPGYSEVKRFQCTVRKKLDSFRDFFVCVPTGLDCILVATTRFLTFSLWIYWDKREHLSERSSLWWQTLFCCSGSNPVNCFLTSHWTDCSLLTKLLFHYLINNLSYQYTKNMEWRM